MDKARDYQSSKTEITETCHTAMERKFFQGGSKARYLVKAIDLILHNEK